MITSLERKISLWRMYPMNVGGKWAESHKALYAHSAVFQESTEIQRGRLGCVASGNGLVFVTCSAIAA
jgi:hypothetical protein